MRVRDGEGIAIYTGCWPAFSPADASSSPSRTQCTAFLLVASWSWRKFWFSRCGRSPRQAGAATGGIVRGCPFTAVTRVRIPSGTPIQSATYVILLMIKLSATFNEQRNS